MTLPAITFKSGLVALVAAVQAYFTATGNQATVSLGWKERTKQPAAGAGRVVFTPSDDSGKGGNIVQPHMPGPRDVLDDNGNVVARVRALRSWERLVVVSVFANDPTNIEDESAQIEATETLYEATVRAVNSFAVSPLGTLAAAGLVWGAVNWTPVPIERVFGRELRAELTFKHPIFDAPLEVVFPQPSINKVME